MIRSGVTPVAESRSVHDAEQEEQCENGYEDESDPVTDGRVFRVVRIEVVHS